MLKPQFALLDPPDNFNLLDEDHPPPRWTGEWVSRRLVEGLKTLRSLPLKSGAPAQFKNSWPAYAWEWGDLLAQAQGEAEALRANQREQNRTRILPSLWEVSRCETVIAWPLYLADRNHLLFAVNCVGWAYACEHDTRWVVKRFGGYTETWLAHYTQGCAVISDRLRTKRIPVF